MKSSGKNVTLKWKDIQCLTNQSGFKPLNLENELWKAESCLFILLGHKVHFQEIPVMLLLNFQ